MDYQHRTQNLVNAASSLKNYDFDFGNLPGLPGPGVVASKPGGGGSLGGIGGTSLKQQKLAGTTTPLSHVGSTGSTPSPKAPELAAPIAPNFRPMANPWEAAAEKMKGAVGPTTATVHVAQSHTVQAAYKEKTSPGLSGIAGPSGSPSGSTQPSWMANYLSSAQAGTAIGKPDPLANLWSTATSTAAVTGTRSTGVASGQAAAGAGLSDPFDFSAGGKTSLSAMKAVKSKPGGAGEGLGGSPGLRSTPAKATQSASSDPFNLSGVKAAMPSPEQPSVAPGVSSPLADPFSSFSGNTSGGSAPKAAVAGDPFAAFGGFPGAGATAAAPAAAGSNDPFGGFGASSSGSMNGGTAAASTGFDPLFGTPPSAAAAPPASGGSSDPFADMLFAPAQPAAAAAPQGGGAVGADDWGSVFGESAVTVDADGGGTTELEGLPPPPAGLTAGTAAEKGEAFYKAGQFADAIKWLLWAEALVGGADGDAARNQMLQKVLTTRSGCYKEAGEMKKAVLDCSRVLELDPENTAVRMQRALLYEGLEKYKQGVDDLREVVKLDPANRPAMNLLNRLQKMV